MKFTIFTDIHFGCKNNSALHNLDCMNFVKWMIADHVKNRRDGFIFLGDWFENRNAINVSTLNESHDALELIDKLGQPIYFCVGNHDLYHRENRTKFSTYHFRQFKNVKLVNEVLIDSDMMFFPFLFKKEYAEAAALIEKHKPKYVFGHFEFQNFVLTGTDRRLEHGPDHKLFSIPTFVFSGHFHKRQVQDNVIYVGNTFPTNYGDIWDDERGFAILDTKIDEVKFKNWQECPKYRKFKLSALLESDDPSDLLPKQARVKCVIDTDINYSEAQGIREEMIQTFSLREFVLEENSAAKKQALTEGETENIELDSVDEMVISMLKTSVTKTSTIDNQQLVEIYESL